MHIAHINLSKELRGGEWQTIALVEALATIKSATTVSQTLVVRKDSLFHRHCASLDGFDLSPVRPNLSSAVFAARNADVIHVQEGRSTKVGALMSLFGVPFVITRRIPNRPKDFFLTRWIYARAANISCVSNDVAEVMRDYSRTANIETVFDCARPLAPATGVGHAKDTRMLTAAVIGAIDFSHKGQDLLVDVARHLAARGVSVRFLIAGTGRDEEALREKMRGLENIQMLGWVDDIANLLSQVDFVVHPARKEGLGSVLLEAMSHGKPIVAARVGGIPEIVTHDHDGLLFEAESSSAIEDAIMKLATHPQLLENFARNARATAEQYSPEIMARRYLETYRQVANCSGTESVHELQS